MVVPYAVIGSIFGMNNADLPVDASWGWLIGGTSMVSGLLCVLVIVGYLRVRSRREPPAAPAPPELPAQVITEAEIQDYWAATAVEPGASSVNDDESE